MNTGSLLSRIISARLFKPLSVGLLSGIVGLFCSALPFFERLETDLGLDALFRLRGPRAPPSDVVVVSMNSWSSRRLGLAADPGVWPRSLHARLLHRLDRQGAHGAFEEYLSIHERDDPASFYLRLCSRYRRRPPKDWDGTITLRGT